MTASAQGQAMRGIRVLDLSRVRAGPTCVRMLADFGADVIRVEPPPGADPNANMFVDSRGNGDFQNLNRNKRSLTLNLKAAEGREIFHRLVADADVVVENWRPDVKIRLGVDYDTLRKINPRIILASISGYGQGGPYAKRPGFDQILQGMGGLMSVTGLPGQGPVRAGIAVADSSAGLYSAIGILLALMERERSGQGQWVHTSLLHAQIAMMDFQMARYLNDGDIPEQAGNDHPLASPMGIVQAQDGVLNIGVSGAGNWQRFCRALGQEQWLTDPRFLENTDRIANREPLMAEIEAVTKTDTVAHWVQLINDAGVPAGPVYSVPQVFTDPQVVDSSVTATAQDGSGRTYTLVTSPVILDRTPGAVRSAAPDCGEHTEEILLEVGYTPADITRLQDSHIV